MDETIGAVVIDLLVPPFEWYENILAGSVNITYAPGVLESQTVDDYGSACCSSLIDSDHDGRYLTHAKM